MKQKLNAETQRTQRIAEKDKKGILLCVSLRISALL